MYNHITTYFNSTVYFYIRQGIIPNNLANSVTKKLSIVNDYVHGKDHF